MQKAKCREVFQQLDFDGSGTLESDELSLALNELGLDCRPEAVQEIFAQYDDGHGSIVYADFE